MAAPILPDLAFGPLRAMQERGLRHRLQFEQLLETRRPNGEYVKAWVTEDEEPALLVMGNPEIAELAAAQGVKAQGVLKVKRGRAVSGKRAIVRGTLKGVAWQRLIEVTADLGGNTERIVRRALWIDVEVSR